MAKSPIVSFRLEAPLKRRAVLAAAARGLKLSSYLRELVLADFGMVQHAQLVQHRPRRRKAS